MNKAIQVLTSRMFAIQGEIKLTLEAIQNGGDERELTEHVKVLEEELDHVQIGIMVLRQHL